MIHDRFQEDLFLSKEIITYIFLKIYKNSIKTANECKISQITHCYYFQIE